MFTTQIIPVGWAWKCHGILARRASAKQSVCNFILPMMYLHASKYSVIFGLLKTMFLIGTNSRQKHRCARTGVYVNPIYFPCSEKLCIHMRKSIADGIVCAAWLKFLMRYSSLSIFLPGNTWYYLSEWPPFPWPWILEMILFEYPTQGMSWDLWGYLTLPICGSKGVISSEGFYGM